MANIDHTQGTNYICDDIAYLHKYHLFAYNINNMPMFMFILVIQNNNSSIPMVFTDKQFLFNISCLMYIC